MKQNYIVTVEEDMYSNYIGIIHDLSDSTLERVRETIEKDTRWDLDVSSETFALPCGMMMSTNYTNIRIIISTIEELN